MKRGFTLIEMVATIQFLAIGAAIVVPNLVESKQSANESTTIANLKSYVTAQQVYMANNYSMHNPTTYNEKKPIKRYAPSWQNLGGTDNPHINSRGNKLQLIPAPFADADKIEDAFNGYWFGDIAKNSGGMKHSESGWKYTFATGTVPAVYGTTGKSAFCVDHSGLVLMQDAKAAGVIDDPTLGGTMPKVDTNDWIPAQ
jgi:prepilin-type N-terminal cleavage/methylation domain-containing protein